LSRLNGRKDDYIERSIRLIDALPEVSSISELEIRAVFHEVIKGLLEWAYHNSDGKYEMSEYVKLALEGEDLTFRLSENDVEKLHSSWIWPNIKRLGRPRTP